MSYSVYGVGVSRDFFCDSDRGVIYRVDHYANTEHARDNNGGHCRVGNEIKNAACKEEPVLIVIKRVAYCRPNRYCHNAAKVVPYLAKIKLYLAEREI